MPVRVLVCGGRKYDNRENVRHVLDTINKERGIVFIIHGAAPGADSEAALWAKSRKIPDHPFCAMWRTYGNNAGAIRNQLMIDEGHPDLVVAFPGGAGTLDMKNRAIKAGIELMEA